MTEFEFRRIYPAVDPAALRVEMFLAEISMPPDVAVAIDAGTHGGNRAPVKIVMSRSQATHLTRRLQALDELHA